MIKVVIDKREKKDRRDFIEDRFSTFKDVSTVEDTIPVGDYLVMKDDGVLFAIEWKTYSDLVSSIQNGHIQSQLDDMDNYDRPYLFVTGTYKQWISKAKRYGIHVSKPQIMGFITSVAGRHKTKLVQYDSEGEAVDGMIKLISIHSGDATQDTIKMPERVKRSGDIHADMMLCVPGLGAKKVKAIREANITFSDLLDMCRKNNGSSIKINGVSVSASTVDYLARL